MKIAPKSQVGKKQISYTGKKKDRAGVRILSPQRIRKNSSGDSSSGMVFEDYKIGITKPTDRVQKSVTNRRLNSNGHKNPSKSFV